MSRSGKIDVVEQYFNGLNDKDLAPVPFAANISFEGPLMPRLTGRDTVLGFLNSILPMIKAVHVKQHIVDGDYVATVLDMETINGVDHVVDVCLVRDGEIAEVRAFYYPSQPPQ
jgi:ketosteroid isomerase-like protein